MIRYQRYHAIAGNGEDHSSRLSAINNRRNCFFKSDSTDDGVYRALDIFAHAKKRTVSAMNRTIEARGKETPPLSSTTSPIIILG